MNIEVMLRVRTMKVEGPGFSSLSPDRKRKAIRYDTMDCINVRPIADE